MPAHEDPASLGPCWQIPGLPVGREPLGLLTTYRLTTVTAYGRCNAPHNTTAPPDAVCGDHSSIIQPCRYHHCPKEAGASQQYTPLVAHPVPLLHRVTPARHRLAPWTDSNLHCMHADNSQNYTVVQRRTICAKQMQGVVRSGHVRGVGQHNMHKAAAHGAPTAPRTPTHSSVGETAAATNR